MTDTEQVDGANKDAKSTSLHDVAPVTPSKQSGARPSALLMPASTPVSAATSALSTPSISGGQATAPTVSLDLAEFPPAWRNSGSAKYGDEDEVQRAESNDHPSSFLVQGTNRQHEPEPSSAARLGETNQHSSPSSQKAGVGFLQRRLRSAIGQDLVFDESSTDSSDTVRSGGVDIVNKDAEGQQSSLADRSRNTSAEDVRCNDGHENKHRENTSKAWGWSTFTSLPSSITLDGALRSMSLSRKETEQVRDASTHAESSQQQEQKPFKSSDVYASDVPSYIAALDVRRWFSAAESSTSGSRIETPASPDPDTRKGKKDVLHSNDGQHHAAKLKAKDKSALRHMSAGSYPSSKTTRSKKGAEKIFTSASVRDSNQKQKSSSLAEKIVEHDMTGATLGMQSIDEAGERFPDHEFLVLSTAGKPIFASNVSKARLERARNHRERKRRKDIALEEKQAESPESAAKLAQDDADEEDRFVKEEQDLQDEEDQRVATRVGLVQALISNYAEAGHKVLNEKSRELLELPAKGRIRFLLKPPLYLVAIALWDEAETTLKSHLEYLYFAIVSLLSLSKLNRFFDRAANFDLKRLLQGTDGILDALLTRIQSDTTAMRGTLQPLRLDAALRHDAGAGLIPTRSRAQRPQDALYCLLLTRNGLVTIARARAHSIHPIDCQLLINTVFATKALKEGGTQSWVPICLPKFAPQGFVYAHVSFLDDDESIVRHAARQQSSGSGEASVDSSITPGSQSAQTKEERDATRPDLGLVLVTGNPDGFEEMSAWRARIVERLRKDELLVKLWLRIRGQQYQQHDESQRNIDAEIPPSISVVDTSRSHASYSADELGLPGLRHFCFKWRSNVQSTSPIFEETYVEGSEGHRRLLYLYGLAHQHVLRSTSNAARSASEDDESTTESRFQELNKADKQSITSESREADDADARATANSGPSTRSDSPPIIPKSVLGRATSTINNQTDRQSTKVTSPSRMHVIRSPHECVLAWNTQPFELAFAASPHMGPAALTHLAKSIAKWVKQEEHRLFIVSAPVF